MLNLLKSDVEFFRSHVVAMVLVESLLLALDNLTALKSSFVFHHRTSIWLSFLSYFFI